MKKTSDSTQSPDTLKLKKHRLIIAVLSVLAVLLLLAGLARLIGPPLMDAVRNKESFRLWIDAQGPWKYLIMVGIMTAQIIVALVPGAPVEMAAGYAFGLWGGVGLCLIGTAIGNAIVILLTRVFGMRMVRLFMDDDKILALTQKLTREQKRMDLMVFVLFLIPGTPKDLMTYVAGCGRASAYSPGPLSDPDFVCPHSLHDRKRPGRQHAGPAELQSRHDHHGCGGPDQPDRIFRLPQS